MTTKPKAAQENMAAKGQADAAEKATAARKTAGRAAGVKKAAAKGRIDVSGDGWIAYVSTYTTGAKETYGIRIFNVDIAAGRMEEMEKISISNSSYIASSHNRKFLYSITDIGVEAYKIAEDGDLILLNFKEINGMRGCYLSLDHKDRYLFCAGYHDGKVTVMRLKENGRIEGITDEVYHKGLGLGSGRNYMPHVECVKMTRDNRFLCSADSGMDRINVYQFNHDTGKLKMVDIVHCDQDAAPRHMQFSLDGRFMYVVNEQKSNITVYGYSVNKDGMPDFEKLQVISTSEDDTQPGIGASALKFSTDFKFLVSSNMGSNDVVVYRVDERTGLLHKVLILPIAGLYPKDAALFPDNKHLVSLNHESNTMTFFTFDEKKGTIVMNGPELPVDRPNCVVFQHL